MKEDKCMKKIIITALAAVLLLILAAFIYIRFIALPLDKDGMVYDEAYYPQESEEDM